MIEKNEIDLLRNYFKNSLEKEGYAKRTIELYLFWFNKFPHSQLENLNEEDGQELIDDWIRSRKHNHSVARAFLKNYLELVKLDNKYRIPKAKKVRKEFKFKDALSKDEIKKLSKAMMKTGYLKWLAFRLIYEGGLRKSELKSVKYSSFNWDKWLKNPNKPVQLKVIGKGNKERWVLISSRTIKRHWMKIKEKGNKSDNDLVRMILNAKKRDIKLCKFGESWFFKHIKKIGKQELGKNVYPHLLRHSRATHLLDSGVEVKDIQNYLGHANLVTTEIYLHRDKKESIKNINKIISNE